MYEVIRAFGADSPIDLKILNVKPENGDSCFQKDILNLMYLCRHPGQPLT